MKPKMILFDYGQTLIVEPQFDWMAANRAILAHTTLPKGMTEDDFCRRSDALFNFMMGTMHENDREFEHVKFLRLLCDSNSITLDIPIEEADLLYWDSATHGSFASPGAREFLDFAKENGIRTGIISNMCYANSALRTRVARYLPNHNFEFILTSSDYVLRKPEPLLFEVACRRAKLDPSEIWYVGDNPRADVLGASGAGLYPVLYTGAHKRTYDQLPRLRFDIVDSFDELRTLVENA